MRATRLATEHLIGLGHRRIGVLTGLAGLVTSEDRLQGYLEAHDAAAIGVDTTLLLHGDFEQATAFESVRDVMRRLRPPTALVSFSNLMTLGAMLALRDLGLSIPQDVSLVGIDDLDFADLLTPPPTVVRAPIAEMAERSICLLLEEIETKRRPLGNLEVYPPQLVERASCMAKAERPK